MSDTKSIGSNRLSSAGIYTYHTTMTLDSRIKKYRIPKKHETVFKNILLGKPLSKEQDQIADRLLMEDERKTTKARQNFRKLIHSLRIMHDVLVLEDGEIVD